MAGGFSITVNTGPNFAKTARALQRVQRLQIPKAKASAFARAGNTTLAAISTELSTVAGVPKWMIRGVGGGAGAKSSGARVRRTRYIPSQDGIIIIFLHRHVNPAGNVRKRNAVTTLKSGGVRVAAVGKTYPGAFYRPSDYGGAIFTREGRDLKMAQIDLDPWAERLVRRTTARILPAEFAKRFTHEIGRRRWK